MATTGATTPGAKRYFVPLGVFAVASAALFFTALVLFSGQNMGSALAESLIFTAVLTVLMLQWFRRSAQR